MIIERKVYIEKLIAYTTAGKENAGNHQFLRFTKCSIITSKRPSRKENGKER